MRRNEIKDDLKELAFDFLYFFARFEFALKVNGYLKKPHAGQPAEAGWKLFRERWEGDYQTTEAAAALIKANPKKQVVGEGGTLDFRPVAFSDNTSPLGRVIVLCQTVRNNLFHGGKSGPNGWDGPECQSARNVDPLSASNIGSDAILLSRSLSSRRSIAPAKDRVLLCHTSGV